MLSKNEKVKGCYSKFSLPMLDEPKTVRIKFCKTGNLTFISHLDLQRTFHRVLVRAGIPMWYTKGFNPHAKLVFGVPLSVGAESMCELADLKIERKISFDDIKKQLNAQLTDEMYVLEVYKPESKFADIAFADYTLRLTVRDADESMAKNIEKLFASSVMMMKRTKSGESEVDITRFIKKLSARYEDGAIVINTVLSTGNTENLNPEYLVTAIKGKLGLLLDPINEGYSIMRNKLFDANLAEFR